MTSEQRRKLFNNQDKLPTFAEKVMPIVDPMPWDDFSESCKVRDYDLATAVAKSLGEQGDYEAQSTYSFKKFAAYLREKLSAYLTYLLEEEQREKETIETANKEPSSSETEFITIDLPKISLGSSNH